MSIDLPVILIGPIASGKSSVASELSKLTGITNVPMDDVRWYYYYKEGYSYEYEEQLSSFTKVMEYWKPFEVVAVKNILADFPNSIIDFGAGHSYCPEELQLKEVKGYLKHIKNIFLLLPSKNPDDSLRVCNERLKKIVKRDLKKSEIEANINFINHKSNYELAKNVIYTGQMEPIEVAKNILEKMS